MHGYKRTILQCPLWNRCWIDLQEGLVFFHSYSGFNKITIALEDQEKTTFVCLNGTSSFKTMKFGLCKPLIPFQRCMILIFSNKLEDTIEMFMGNYFYGG